MLAGVQSTAIRGRVAIARAKILQRKIVALLVASLPTEKAE